MNKEIEKALQHFTIRKIMGITDNIQKYEDLAITALEAQQDDMWIPVTEKLPSEDNEYIVTLESGDVDLDIFKDNKWFNWNGYKFGLKVIAWRPLPEPWKEEQP